MSLIRCCLAVSLAVWSGASLSFRPAPAPAASVLRDHLLVTWYGNPLTPGMGVLGHTPARRGRTGCADRRRRTRSRTSKRVLMAYHLVAVIARITAGADGRWRRRETRDVIQAMLDEARANGFRLDLSMCNQAGRPSPRGSRGARTVSGEPDVDLALDPEWNMSVVPKCPAGRSEQMPGG